MPRFCSQPSQLLNASSRILTKYLFAFLRPYQDTNQLWGLHMHAWHAWCKSCWTRKLIDRNLIHSNGKLFGPRVSSYIVGNNASLLVTSLYTIPHPPGELSGENGKLASRGLAEKLYCKVCSNPTNLETLAGYQRWGQHPASSTEVNALLQTSLLVSHEAGVLEYSLLPRPQRHKSALQAR